MVSFLWEISPPRLAQASMYALVHSTGALRIISDRLRMSSFHLSSCVRGYNVSKDGWSASVGAVLQRERENRTAKILTRGSPERRPDCGTRSTHHILPLLRVCSAVAQ